MKDIYDILAAADHWGDQKFALATLVQAEGSSYRRPGARMLITLDGRCAGSLSGGCLEEEVAGEARSVLADTTPKLIDFDTRRRFGCNGRIEIFIEPVSATLLTDIATHLEQRSPCTIATVFGLSSVGEADSFPDGSLGSRIILNSEREADSIPYSSCKDAVFVQEIKPPLRLLVIGDGPDSKPIRRLSEILGWQSFEVPSAESLPASTDNWTAAIVKTHNYGRDFAALQELLPLNLRYVGLIGPRQRRDQILHNLLEAGISINSGFFAPAGLDLNAETPEEIALAIVGEIQRVFAHGTGESLRERKVPIHLGKARSKRKAALKWETSLP